MATKNLLLGTAKGKLGDIVFTRRNGKQVTRVRVTPKNPQSEAQCRQRMAFATISNASHYMKSIVDHSFEGVPVGATSLQHFMKLNMPMVRAKALVTDADWQSGAAEFPNEFLIKGAKGVAELPWRISQGSLDYKSYALGLTGKDVLIKDAEMPVTQITDATSYANALATIGLAPGEQLSVILVSTDYNVEATYSAPNGDAMNRTTYVGLARIIFKNANAVDFSQPFSLIENNQFNTNVVNYERTADWIGNVSVAQAGADLQLVFGLPDANALVMCAVVRSRLAYNGWQYSSAQLIGTWQGEDATAEVVWYSYRSTQSSAESRYYLQQANNPSGTENDDALAPAFGEITSETDGVAVAGRTITMSQPISELSELVCEIKTQNIEAGITGSVSPAGEGTVIEADASLPKAVLEISGEDLPAAGASKTFTVSLGGATMKVNVVNNSPAVTLTLDPELPHSTTSTVQFTITKSNGNWTEQEAESLHFVVNGLPTTMSSTSTIDYSTELQKDVINIQRGQTGATLTCVLASGGNVVNSVSF